jgi:hypothetical protein
MCLVCIEYERGKLTIAEARRNLGELITYDIEDPLQEHYVNLEQSLWEKEQKDE